MLYLQERPLGFGHGLFDLSDVRAANAAARRALGGRTTAVFDSHLRLQEEYVRACGPGSSGRVPDDPEGRWLCSSENHSGTIVTGHWAGLLLRYINGYFTGSPAFSRVAIAGRKKWDGIIGPTGENSSW